MADITAKGPNSRAEVVNLDYDAITVQIESPKFYAMRTIRSKEEIHNDSFSVDKEHRGQGLGTRVFANQVQGAREEGFEKITTMAARSSNMNGYYTWARLGYDGDFVGHSEKEKIKSSPVPKATKVSQLMKTPEGRSWWKDKGWSKSMTFDLQDDSLSLQRLRHYLKVEGYKDYDEL